MKKLFMVLAATICGSMLMMSCNKNDDLQEEYTGVPLDIYVISPDGELTVHHLSADGEMQVVIEPEQWFAAELPGKTGFSLVGCAVAPAFTFGNFELAKKELLRDFPQHKAIIERLSHV